MRPKPRGRQIFVAGLFIFAVAVTAITVNRARHAAGPSSAAPQSRHDDAVKHLKDQQVRFAADPFETPCCHMAVVQDPDGNKLIIHKLKPENEKGVCK